MNALLLNNPLSFLWLMAVLWLAVLGPFLALWIALSMRRDLRRIADALQHSAARFDMVTHDAVTGQMKQVEPLRTYVRNSAFGR
jgi:hypothetical protein